MAGLTDQRLIAYQPPRWASKRLASARGISMANLALSGHSILVVEDEPLIALDLRETLASAGACVFAASKLSHALQLAGHPDLSAAVLDYRLGDDDSAAICSALEQLGIPFVFYSGYDDMQQLWPHAMRVPKPAAGSRIVEAVTGALTGARLTVHAA
jgi:CheY-like chemotaxis protein